MQLQTCLFCKRSLEQFCYSIYDPANQPYLNIMQLFGDVEDALRHGRYICHECLYLIRWIYFMKKILSDALQDEDIGENDRVIPAFQIFKVKMSQPIFVFTDDGGSDGEGETNEENDSENECRTPRNAQDYSFNGESHLVRKQIESGRREGNEHLSHDQTDQTDGNSNWWLPQQNCDLNNQRVLCNGENRLTQYSCTINICKHACDTLDKLKNHYYHHHSSEQHDLTLDVYGKQLQEFNRHNYSPSSQRRKKFRCLLTHCRKSFKSLDSLSDHKVKEHELLAKFWCGECFNLPFVSQNDLNQHTLMYHSHNDVLRRLSEYPCKYCDKYFLEQNLLTAHQVKHHQVQCQTQSGPRFQNQTSIVKRVVKEYPFANSAHKSPTKEGICSFKVRRQKEVTYTKQTQNEKLNWLKMKYPHAISKPVVSNASEKNVSNVAVAVANEQSKEKVLISLPPRKRRQYQVANEIDENEHTKVAQNLHKIASVESVQTKPAIMTEIKENMPLDSNKMNIVEKSEAIKVLNGVVDAATKSLLENNNLVVENVEEINEKPPHLVNGTLKSVHNEEIVDGQTAKDVMSSEREETAEIPDDKSKLPLKTYNCRKRKKASNASTTSKKTKESVETAEVNNEMPTLHIEAEDVHSHSQDTLSTSSSSIPPVISKIEEKDNDNTPGRITMTISLKAIKQYTNDKEEKRESKRKKKLKGKRKCKTIPSTSSQGTASQVINSPAKNGTDVVSATDLDASCNTSMNHDNLNVPLENCSNSNSNTNSNSNASDIDEKQVSDAPTPAEIAAEPAEFSHPSRDISESENESRHEIVLNKDEINMIIFGDTMRSNSVCSDVSMINEQIIDGRENQENSINAPLNTEPVEKSPKKKGKLKAKVGKKRKIKRKPDKILKLTLDADGKVIDRKKMHKKVSNDSDAEDTVEGQIANVQLKDHLYARSAFNAFKTSRADPSE